MANILVIDDADEILEMLTMVLKTFGHEVVGSSGSIEVSKLISFHNPQLVLLDVLLPNMSGKDICKTIKKIKPDLPVILMSANSKLLSHYHPCHADDIIEKPFDMIELKNKIQNLLQRSLTAGNAGNINRNSATNIKLC